MCRSNSLLANLFAAGLVLTSLVGAVSAQMTTDWMGTSSANWTDAANWGGGVPSAETDVFINRSFVVLHDPVLDADGWARSITMGNGGDSALTISEDFSFDVGYVNSETGNFVGGMVLVGELGGSTSTITQSNGTVRCGELWLGSTRLATFPAADGVGVYNIEGGTLNITGRQIVVGEQGHGTFTQTGGVVNNPDAFYVGDNWYGHAENVYPGAGGTMTISGGVFNGGADIGIIGTWGGNGVLNVNGTGVLNQRALEMGLGYHDNTAGSNSAINLSDDGEINLTGHIRLAANEATTGVLTQTGGTLTVGTLMQGPGLGTYNLIGGTLNVSAVEDMDITNDGATLNVGGAEVVTKLVFGDPGGDPINIALGKTATQSSNPWGFNPENAVDGNYGNFCHTDNEENSWWRVDLTGDSANITLDQIRIHGRSDGPDPQGFNQHFSNFFVRVYDTDGGVLYEEKFYSQSDLSDPPVKEDFLPRGGVIQIDLSSAIAGRWVEIAIDGYNLNPDPGWDGTNGPNGYLFFAEMEVIDTNTPSTPPVYTNYTQGSAGTLGIELDPTSGLCDRLVAGVISLAGTLDVTSLGGSFAVGQVFDILDWDSLIGTFDTVNLPVLPGSLAWDASNLYTTGALAVVSGQAIPGDADRNGVVDEEDAKLLASNWGASGQGIGWEQGDFNGDGRVDAVDAAIMAANWGASSAVETTAVPEPGILAMLAGTVMAYLAGRRRPRN